MSYNATVYNVMIASPADVATERQVVRDVVHAWNDVHAEDRGIVLMPIGWDTHSAPSMGNRAQEIINKQVLTNADLLVAVFWTRIGSPTGKSPSGTIEEIEEHLSAGKPAMIYFSSAPVRPDSVQEEQYAALREFKAECLKRGLIETYESIGEFHEKLTRQLTQTVIRDFPDSREATELDTSIAVPQSQHGDLSAEATELLLEVAQDQNGQLIKIRTSGGLHIQTNNKDFGERHNPRSEALWEAAVFQLRDFGLLQERGYKGEVFSITNQGYALADVLRDRQ